MYDIDSVAIERSYMFKMAFRVVYRIKGRCSRHPAYNPVKDEQGGIKGGCKECYALFHRLSGLSRIS